MARQKSLTKSLSITQAGRAHNCRSNKKHRILRGESRLTVKEGSDELNYCLTCAAKFIDAAIDELNELRGTLPK